MTATWKELAVAVEVAATRGEAESLLPRVLAALAAPPAGDAEAEARLAVLDRLLDALQAPPPALVADRRATAARLAVPWVLRPLTQGRPPAPDHLARLGLAGWTAGPDDPAADLAQALGCPAEDLRAALLAGSPDLAALLVAMRQGRPTLVAWVRLSPHPTPGLHLEVEGPGARAAAHAAWEAVSGLAAQAVPRLPLSRGYLVELDGLPDGARVDGGSLGLPLALAFYARLAGARPARRLAATGTLDASGRVGAVAPKDLAVAARLAETVLVPPGWPAAAEPVQEVATLGEAVAAAGLPDLPGSVRARVARVALPPTGVQADAAILALMRRAVASGSAIWLGCDQAGFLAALAVLARDHRVILVRDPDDLSAFVQGAWPGFGPGEPGPALLALRETLGEPFVVAPVDQRPGSPVPDAVVRACPDIPVLLQGDTSPGPWRGARLLWRPGLRVLVHRERRRPRGLWLEAWGLQGTLALLALLLLAWVASRPRGPHEADLEWVLARAEEGDLDPLDARLQGASDEQRRESWLQAARRVADPDLVDVALVRAWQASPSWREDPLVLELARHRREHARWDRLEALLDEAGGSSAAWQALRRDLLLATWRADEVPDAPPVLAALAGMRPAVPERLDEASFAALGGRLVVSVAGWGWGYFEEPPRERGAFRVAALGEHLLVTEVGSGLWRLLDPDGWRTLWQGPGPADFEMTVPLGQGGCTAAEPHRLEIRCFQPGPAGWTVSSGWRVAPDSRVAGLAPLPGDRGIAVFLSEWQAYELRALDPEGRTIARLPDLGAGYGLVLWGERLVVGLNGMHRDPGTWPDPPHRSAGGLALVRLEGEVLREEQRLACPVEPCRFSLPTTAQLDGVGEPELMVNVQYPERARELWILDATDPTAPLVLSGLDLKRAFDLDGDGRDELILSEESTERTWLAGVEDATGYAPPPRCTPEEQAAPRARCAGTPLLDVGPAPETRTRDAWELAALLVRLGMLDEARRAFSRLEARGGETERAARLAGALLDERLGDLDRAVAAWRALAEGDDAQATAARQGLERWAWFTASLDSQPWDPATDTAWRLDDPLRGTRLVPTGLRLADLGPEAARALRPTTVVGTAELRFRLEIERTEWSSGAEVGLFDEEGRPLAVVHVEAGGGGANGRLVDCRGAWLTEVGWYLQQAQSPDCGQPQRGNHCWLERASLPQSFDVLLRLDPASGRAGCRVVDRATGQRVVQSFGLYDPGVDLALGGASIGAHGEPYVAELEALDWRLAGLDLPDGAGDPGALALARDDRSGAAALLPPGLERDVARLMAGDSAAAADLRRRVTAPPPGLRRVDAGRPRRAAAGRPGAGAAGASVRPPARDRGLGLGTLALHRGLGRAQLQRRRGREARPRPPPQPAPAQGAGGGGAAAERGCPPPRRQRPRAGAGRPRPGAPRAPRRARRQPRPAPGASPGPDGGRPGPCAQPL